MGLIIIIIVLVFVSSLFIYKKVTIVNYHPTAYESELIKYFKEVALQSEHGDYINKIIKWRKPMLLYVIKDKAYKEQMVAIKKAIEGINYLATDGFKIELTEDPKKGNTFLYLCSREKVAELAPNFYKKFTDDVDIDISGYADMEFYWNNHNIYKASIYVDPQDPIDIQESIILEEITQSIGLPYDPESHPNSIFYEHKAVEGIKIYKYSELDKDIIKLLYHARMKPGINEKEVENVIKRILKNKEIKLSGN